MFFAMSGVVISICICVLIAYNGVECEKSEEMNFRIIDGELADIKEFPFQVSIIYKNLHHCGGSIISKWHILTAAHCAVRIAAKNLQVRVGSNTIDTGGIVHKVEKVFIHPNFTSKYEFDVAILKLATALEFNNRAQPVQLAGYLQRLPPVGSLALISGWGRTNASVDMMSDHLISIELPLISHRLCEKLYNNKKFVVDSRMFCAGRLAGGRDSCLGDSGGALVIDHIQYGIVSWGVGCALKNRPGVYASVPRLRMYIRKVSGV